MRHRPLLLLAIVVGIGGCTDPLSPSDVAGTYLLSRVGRTAIPGRYVHAISGDTIVMAFDSLELRRGGELRSRSRYTWRPADGGAPMEVDAEVEGTWSLDGTSVITAFGCPAGSFCLSVVAPVEYTRIGDALVRREPGLGQTVRERVGAAIE